MRLAAKLLQIRVGLGLSQSQIARLLDVGVNTPRISEYESGAREPALITLLAYAYLVGISTDDLIDDTIDLPVEIRVRRRRKRIALPYPNDQHIPRR
jgi:transcriptional regulator with XRE-family HTH domain